MKIGKMHVSLETSWSSPFRLLANHGNERSITEFWRTQTEPYVYRACFAYYSGKKTYVKIIRSNFAQNSFIEEFTNHGSWKERDVKLLFTRKFQVPFQHGV